LLAAGETYDLLNQHDRAREQYQAVIDAAGNSAQAEAAHKYMSSAYRGR
jgi:hypothetical protein